MRKIFVSLSVLLCYNLTWSQKTFYKGYIVTVKGEKQWVFIDYKNWDLTPESVSFKADSLSTDLQVMDLYDLMEFGIPGIATYEKHTCTISMDNTDINTLKTGPDNSVVEKTIFLETFVINDGVKFFVYHDRLKERYFIKDTSDERPVELQYKIYYRNTNDNIAVKEEKYKQQLVALLAKYGKDDERIGIRVKRVPYERIPLYGFINNYIGEKKGIIKKMAQISKTKVRPFVQAGAFFYKYGDGYFFHDNITDPPKKSTFVIAGGFDFYLDKFRNKVFIHLEAAYSRHSYSSATTYKSGVAFIREQRNIIDNHLAFNPTINFSVYSSNDWNFFVGGGLGTVSSTARTDITQRDFYDQSGNFSGSYKVDDSKGALSTLTLSLMPTIIIKDRVQLMFLYNPDIAANSSGKGKYMQFRLGYYLNKRK